MNFKIFVFSLPATGHTNPLAVVLERLINTYKCTIIWYTVPKFRAIAEKIGAKYRQLNNVTHTDFDTHITLDSHLMPLRHIMNAMFRLIDNNMDMIVRDVINDEPNYVICDSMGVHFKWALKKLERLKKVEKLPRVIYFSSIFAYESGIFPSWQELEILVHNYTSVDKIQLAYDTIYSYSKYWLKQWSYGLSLESPHNDIFECDANSLKLITTFPQLQARHELLNENTKFIGACINENCREMIENSKLANMLKRFPSINREKLIYISMGTMFNKNKELFKIILEGIRDISLSDNDLFFIVSTGGMLGELTAYSCDNILLLQQVPQLEILKKSSLFITHCGMNSVNEAIYYGVPMICIPLSVDQPLVAHRLTHDLNLGVYIDYTKMTPELIREKISQVLNDSSFNVRLSKYSQISHEYDGKIIGADVIYEYMIKNQTNTY